MAKGNIGVAEEAQRDPTGQPFAFDKAGAAVLAMMFGDAVGRRDMAVAQGPAHQDFPLPPPAPGPHQIVRHIRQQ